MATYRLPSGTYRAVYEDDDGYYYQAPQKIELHGIGGSRIIDGGLYIKRSEKEPHSFYFILVTDPQIFDVEIDQNLIQKIR